MCFWMLPLLHEGHFWRAHAFVVKNRQLQEKIIKIQSNYESVTIALRIYPFSPINFHNATARKHEINPSIHVLSQIVMLSIVFLKQSHFQQKVVEKIKKKYDTTHDYTKRLSINFCNRCICFLRDYYEQNKLK